MATMTMTTTQTWTRQPNTQDSAHGQETQHQETQAEQPRDYGITAREHTNERLFLETVPQLERLRQNDVTARTLRLLLQQHGSNQKSGAGGIPSHKTKSRLDTAINVLVIELALGDSHREERFHSVGRLREYLRNQSTREATRRVVFVSVESFSEELVGLLGHRLELDSDFFAMHIAREELPLEYRLHSSAVRRRSLRFEYWRGVGKGRVEEERLSMCISQRSEESYTGKCWDFHV